jgi:hypothetical protein
MSGCSRQVKTGDVIYAGWNDLFVIDTAEGKIVRTVPAGTRINDLEPSQDDRLFMATARGLLVVRTTDLELEQVVPIGILDSIEYDPERNLIYALLHPGSDPNQSNGPHKLVKLSGESYRELGSVSLEPWTFDVFLSPSGEDIYVTHMAGRSVIRIDAEELVEKEKIWFGEGGEWEGRMVLVRHLTFSSTGSPLYAVEQGEANPTCLWIYSLETGEMQRSCLESDAKVQGIVTSPDGSRIFANGLTELIVMSSSGEEVTRTELGAKHRWITLGSNKNRLYLTADTGEEEGLITCADLEGSVVKEIRLPTPLNVIAVPFDRKENEES